jgi:2,4-dienoyl-CoA reductase-like NADH-dependent reductase (Old Yellow Enzyme family)
MEVFQAIKDVSPANFIVGIRISESKVNDLTYRWPGGSETATEIFQVLSEIKPAYLHIAAEGGRWTGNVCIRMVFRPLVLLKS